MKCQVDLTKARAIAAMLASDHDGEVLAAARALTRLAKAAGLCVQDLIHPAGIAPKPAQRHRSEPAWHPMEEASHAYAQSSARVNDIYEVYLRNKISEMAELLRRQKAGNGR